VFIVLADQPLIAAGDRTELIGAVQEAPGRPCRGAGRERATRNPILLDEAAHAQILASGTNLLCRT